MRSQIDFDGAGLINNPFKIQNRNYNEKKS